MPPLFFSQPSIHQVQISVDCFDELLKGQVEMAIGCLNRGILPATDLSASVLDGFHLLSSPGSQGGRGPAVSGQTPRAK